MKFTIYAVGSNGILTQEIKKAMDQLLEQTLEVTACTAENLPSHTDGQLYVCNKSLYGTVEKYVDSNRIAILNLMPTSTFYLRISSIPKGAEIYVLNNRAHYCQKLTALCRQTGLTDYRYIPIAYEEMEREAFVRALRQADYIIGVSDILEYVRQSDMKGDLKPTATIIGANRVSSVVTTAGILSQLNQLLFQDAKKQLFEMEETLRNLRDQNLLYEYFDGVTESVGQIQKKLAAILREAGQGKESMVVKAAIHQIL